MEVGVQALLHPPQAFPPPDPGSALQDAQVCRSSEIHLQDPCPGTRAPDVALGPPPLQLTHKMQEETPSPMLCPFLEPIKMNTVIHCLTLMLALLNT